MTSLARILFLFLCVVSVAAAEDHYQNFQELRSHEVEGRDYRIEAVQRGSGITVLAIHGGFIEVATETLAREIASIDHSLYVFSGMVSGSPGASWRLHITSKNFDDAIALKLLNRSRAAISIHGFRVREESERHHSVLVGGLNHELRRLVAVELRVEMGADVFIDNSNRHRFPALDQSNVVNRTTHHGVQLEISFLLRQRFLQDLGYRRRFVAAMKRAMARYECSSFLAP